VLVIDREGHEVAKAFNEEGVAAFVLKYRLPSDETMKDKSIGPLQDAQQAIKMVRQKASDWHINPERIGIMGFSAGGHLAATAGTHFNESFIENAENMSLRPDFMVLVYPVISFTPALGHSGSGENLLGKDPSQDKIYFFSNELQVTPETPPTFLLHAGDDKGVKVANSIRFYEALQANAIPAGLHIYPDGDHGFLKGSPQNNWFDQCIFWIKNNGWLQNDAVAK
jgi:acetyl esterase/lipase